MPIGIVVQLGSNLFIYDEKGRSTGSISLGVLSGREGLRGYTSGNVNVQRGSQIFSYNERGQCVGVVLAGDG